MSLMNPGYEPPRAHNLEDSVKVGAEVGAAVHEHVPVHCALGGMGWTVQGHLAHKKQRPPRTLP